MKDRIRLLTKLPWFARVRCPPSLCVWCLDNTAVIAVMTSDGALYYGRMGMEAKVMKVSCMHRNTVA